MPRYSLAAVVLLFGLVLGACSDGSNRSPDRLLPVAVPEISDPPDVGGPVLLSTTFALDSVGYRQREFFLSGQATAFTSDVELGPDGLWTARTGQQAHYSTRVLVYRPLDDADFSGSVFVEWLNVTTGFELPVVWGTAHTELIRAGHAIVLVSAQYNGIEGAESPLLPLHLKAVNPARYADLSHPGDSFSYDMFTQVVGAIRPGDGAGILEGLTVGRIYAMGQSQSASRLVTYYNAVQPLYGAYDGFLLQSRGDGSSNLSQSPEGEIPAPTAVTLRTDMGAPVINIQSETDVLAFNAVVARQPDSPVFRLWEVAGTAHNDEYTYVAGRADDGSDPRFALVVEQTSILGYQECNLPMNSGYIAWPVNAAVRSLDTWARNGEEPATVDRLRMSAAGDGFELDAAGNVLGGLRTPYVDAPAAVLSGLGQVGNAFCSVFGTTALFDRAAMESRYQDQQGYVAAVKGAAMDSVQAGVLLPEDAERIIQAAPLQWASAPPFRRASLPQIEQAPDTALPTLLGPDFKLSAVGYREAEYFLSGTASSFINTSELGEDGLWEVDNNAAADYRSRIVVHRPVDPADFSGTVIVEWQNVSAGFETAPVWYAGHTEALRRGHAWVFVSAQVNGIEGSPGALLPFHLKAANPERYQGLSHPGDSFAYDLFSQVARAVRDGNVLGGLVPEVVIGVGQSQSAGYLATYVNAIHPLYNAYDAYLIHSRSGGSYPLALKPEVPIRTPRAVLIRADLNVPVIEVVTETDLTLLVATVNRQPDSSLFRRWEVAGTSHADYYTNIASRDDQGLDPQFAVIVEENKIEGGVITCEKPMNDGPLPWVINAALYALDAWARDTIPAAAAERIDMSDDQLAILRDAYGNATGGLRTPHVDVPAATLSGEGQTGESFCSSFGTTKLFDAATMAMLYTDKSGYVQEVAASADKAVAGGFLVPEDADRIKAAAALQWDAL